MIEYATLDGVVIHDLSTDSNVQASSIAGLTGLPTIRGDVYARPENDGIVEPANQYLDARISAWDIGVWGDTIAEARANWTELSRTLLAATRQQKQLRWRARGDTLNLQANVRVAGMTPPILGEEPFYRFQVLLRAADPTNYDQTASTAATGAPSFTIAGLPLPVPFPIPWALESTGAGTVSVTNAGDAPAWPLIDIAGPIESPVVQNQTTGKSLYFDGLSLAVGETLSINMNPASRSASVGGVSKFSTIRFSDSEFFSVSPGATESISFYGSGTDANTTMTVSLRSAYIT